MYKHQIPRKYPCFAVGSGPGGVVLADVDRAVAVDGINVDDVSVGAGITDADVTDAGCLVDGYAGGAGVVIPLFGVAAAAPVRHVAAGGGYFPGGV